MNTVASGLSFLKDVSFLRKPRQLARRAYYYGTQYKCPVCGADTRMRHTFCFDLPVLKELDVIGGEFLEHDNCPICFSGARERLLKAFLEKGFVKSSTRILHIAPEYGLYLALFAKQKNYTAIDFEPERYDTIPGVEYGDITNLKFDDSSFDLIMCNHVLEHVPDDAKAMHELYRVLAPLGVAILQVPFSTKLAETIEDPSVTDRAERERRFGQFDHIRIYGPDYFDRLKRAGFTVEIVDPRTVCGAELDALDINPRERIFVARRSG